MKTISRSRRIFLRGAFLSVGCLPFVVRRTSLMRIKPIEWYSDDEILRELLFRLGREDNLLTIEPLPQSTREYGVVWGRGSSWGVAPRAEFERNPNEVKRYV